MSWPIAFWLLAVAVIAYGLGRRQADDSDGHALGVMVIGYLADPEVSHVTVTRGDVYPGEIEVYAECVDGVGDDE